MRATYSDELEMILINLLHDSQVGDAMDCIQELNEKFGEPSLSTFIKEVVRNDKEGIYFTINVGNGCQCGSCECKPDKL